MKLRGQSWVLRATLVGATLTAVLAFLFPTGARSALWANAAALCALVLFDRAVAVRTRGGLLSLVRILLWIGALPSVSLIMLILLQGDATYDTATAQLSHLGGAWLVAAATVVLNGAMVLGALVIRLRAPVPETSWPVLLQTYGRRFLAFACAMVAAYILARVALVFGLENLTRETVYVLRLYVAFFAPVLFFAGIAARRNLVMGWATTAALLPLTVLMVLAGNRADAIVPFAFLCAGYVAAAPLHPVVARRLAVTALSVFVGAMFVGGTVREDRRGRSGQAALERAGELTGTLASSSDRESILGATLARLLSNSTHSVITRIPRERPHEPNGLAVLPREVAHRILPGWNLSGVSERDVPRNWMLNELGFLVNWSTSVELTLVADAWYRGGWPGLLLIGVALGLGIGGVERFANGLAARRAEYGLLFVFLAATTPYVVQRDAVHGMRNVVFSFAAGTAVAWCAIVLGKRQVRAVRPMRRREPAVDRRRPGTIR